MDRKISHKIFLTYSIEYYKIHISAEIAQLVEHFTRNEGVVGSSPIFSSNEKAPESLGIRRPVSFVYIAME